MLEEYLKAVLVTDEDLKHLIEFYAVGEYGSGPLGHEKLLFDALRELRARRELEAYNKKE